MSAACKPELMFDLDPKLMEMASDLVESFDDLLSGLIDLRVAKGLTQTEVASRMGVTQPAIAALEAHDANPTITTLVRGLLAESRAGPCVWRVVEVHAPVAQGTVANIMITFWFSGNIPVIALPDRIGFRIVSGNRSSIDFRTETQPPDPKKLDNQRALPLL